MPKTNEASNWEKEIFMKYGAVFKMYGGDLGVWEMLIEEIRDHNKELIHLTELRVVGEIEKIIGEYKNVGLPTTQAQEQKIMSGHEAFGGGGRGSFPMIEVDHTGQVITPEARQLKRIADYLEKLIVKK